MPILESCSVCGGDNIVTLSSDLGGCVCKNCYHNEYIVDLKTISLLKMFSCLKISKIKELNVLYKNKLEIDHFLKNYYGWFKYIGEISSYSIVYLLKKLIF